MRMSIMLIAAVLTGCGSIYTTTKERGTTGLTYYLPNNSIRVAIDITEVSTSAPKDPQTYSAEACGITETVLKKTRSYKYGGVKLSLLATPDWDHPYTIDISTPYNPFSSRKLSMTQNAELIPTDFLSTVDDSTFDFVVSTASAVFGLETAAVAGTRDSSGKPPTTCSVEGNALKERITDIEDRIVELSGGKSPLGEMDVALYEKMRSDLEKQRASALSRFIGATKTKKYTVTVDVDPDLCLEADGKVGCPFLYETVADGVAELKYDCLKSVGLRTYELVNQCKIPAKDTRMTGLRTEKASPGKPAKVDAIKEAGFFYRVPGRVTATVIQEKNDTSTSIGSATLPIAQYGYVAALPRRFGILKSEISELKLDPLTGSLTKVTINGAGLGADQVDQLAGAVSSARADDTISDLERKKKILELQKAIAELEAPPAPVPDSLDSTDDP